MAHQHQDLGRRHFLRRASTEAKWRWMSAISSAAWPSLPTRSPISMIVVSISASEPSDRQGRIAYPFHGSHRAQVRRARKADYQSRAQSHDRLDIGRQIRADLGQSARGGRIIRVLRNADDFRPCAEREQGLGNRGASETIRSGAGDRARRARKPSRRLSRYRVRSDSDTRVRRLIRHAKLHLSCPTR